MENNKTYLQKIHWVFLVSIAFALMETFLNEWLISISSERTAFVILHILSLSGLYAALSIATLKWKEAAIAWVIHIAIYIAHFLLLFSKDPVNNNYIRFAFVVISGIPITVFFALQSGWTKKIVPVYFSAIALSLISTLSFNAPRGIENVARSLWTHSQGWESFFILVSETAGMVFTIICLCELNNFMQGKKSKWKTTLLNPGNDYGKLNSLITFWTLKVMLFVIVIGAGYSLQTLLGLIQGTYRLPGATLSGVQNYYRFIGFIDILFFVAIALMHVWYLRKFLLEYFISYNLNSKFLYWLVLIPVIGFIAFAIIQLHDAKQGQYRDKINGIGNFAASSSVAVTAIFIILYLLRLISRIGAGESIFIVSLIGSLLLFVWFMADKTGYYLIMGLNLLILIVGSAVVFIIAGRELPIPLIFSLILFNVMLTALTFPVYHFGEFEYIPAENDTSEQPENPNLQV